MPKYRISGAQSSLVAHYFMNCVVVNKGKQSAQFTIEANSVHDATKQLIKHCCGKVVIPELGGKLTLCQDDTLTVNGVAIDFKTIQGAILYQSFTARDQRSDSATSYQKDYQSLRESIQTVLDKALKEGNFKERIFGGGSDHGMSCC